MTVEVKATKSGHDPGSSIDELISCDRCPVGAAPACTADSECPSDKRCSGGSCVSVPCECGNVENHECVSYDCCSDADCPDGKSCKEHVCEEREETPQCTSDADCASEEYCALTVGAAGGSCQPVTGDCGYVENHYFVPYECGDDETCPACSEGKTCTDNKCLLYDLTCPTTGAAGQTVTCTVTIDGKPCVGCRVGVTGPDGQTSVLTTDEDGNVEVLFGEPGEYSVTLPKNGQLLKVQASGQSGGQEDGGDDSGDGIAQWILLLLLLVLLGAGVWWLSAKKK